MMRWGWTGYLWQRIFVWFLQQIERLQYHLRVPSRGDIRECLDRRPAKEVVHKRQVFRIQSHLANNNFSKWISRQNIKAPCNAPKMKAENQEQQDTAADPCGRDFLSDLNLRTHSLIDWSSNVWVTWLVWLWLVNMHSQKVLAFLLMLKLVLMKTS